MSCIMPVDIVQFSSALGDIRVDWDEGQVTSLTLLSGKNSVAASRDSIDPVDLQPPQRRLVRQLQRYAEGQPVDFGWVPIDFDSHTAFQRRVLQACRRLTWGRTCTYLQLAQQAGSPKAARAVGNVMANNRVPLIVPCPFESSVPRQVTLEAFLHPAA